jgi:tripartite ATP-independent transporter DctM subunit
MGDFAFYGGLAEGLFYTTSRWVGRLPGGLAIATAIGGAGFGACCGSSVAASAVLGKICIPEMRKHHYPTSVAAGTVAASANLSSMIPPSGLFVVYAIMTDQSVGKLLIAGILPGILMMTLFSIMLAFRTRRNPSLGPRLPQKVSWGEKLLSIRNSWGMLICAAIIIFGIYTGVFTSTEAAVAGAFWTFCLTLFSRRLSFKGFINVLLSTGKNTSMILFIIVGVMIFTRFLAVSRMPTELASLLSGLPVPPVVILSSIILFYFFLGMFFDAISMLVMTLPAFFPTILALGYDPIWFGVICVLMCEVGLLTPPVGVNCYVVAATIPNTPLEEVFRGIWPFVLMNMIALVILVMFPQIALFLPTHMK